MVDVIFKRKKKSPLKPLYFEFPKWTVFELFPPARNLNLLKIATQKE